MGYEWVWPAAALAAFVLLRWVVLPWAGVPA